MPHRTLHAASLHHLHHHTGLGGPAPRSLAMRRRLQVFALVFGLGLLLGLGLDFMRSAVYTASAKLQIIPAPGLVAGAASAAATLTPVAPALQLEGEILRSRALVQQAVEQLSAQGLIKPGADDPVLAVQQLLSVRPVADSQLLQLQAQSPDAALVAPLVNTLVEVYRRAQSESGSLASNEKLDAAREEIRVIEARLAQQRQAAEGYRQRNRIVSSERDENQALARLKGLNLSLQQANDRQAVSEGKVAALEQAVAQGKRLPQARDNPTVAGLEARLSQAREDWRGMERQYTPQYLDMDPSARALKARIANLEQQLESERGRSQQMALAEAREELASTRATVQRLQQQLGGDRQELQSASQQLGAYQVMQAEVHGLEQLLQAARQKLLALESSERARRPQLLVLEPAVTPAAPSSPAYWRDAGLVLAGALLLGFLAVWFFEFFNRSEAPAPLATTVVIPQPMMGLPVVHAPAPLAAAPERALLAQALPRELRAEEIAQLLAAATPEHRPVLAALLCGLTVEESLALQLQHVDAKRGQLQVPGADARRLPLAAPLRAAWALNAAGAPELPLLQNAAGRALQADELRMIVAATAHDAQLDGAGALTPEALRHSYIAFLVRQGLRFSELGQLVGRLSSEALNALAPLAPASERRGVEDIEALLPALRD
ncbi:GumC family protein [Paucibacter soli]|uniref:GumC family protein n=1 Tax=Paucibacter soli TaxID=3133433 RepID=UPI0030B527D8